MRKIYKLKDSSCDCNDCRYFRKQKDGFYTTSDTGGGFFYLMSFDGRRSSISYIKDDVIEIKPTFGIDMDKLFEL